MAKPTNTRKKQNNESEKLFLATERNAKLRYEGEERACGSFDSEAEKKKEVERDVILNRH